jgi:hypothetical protein
VIRATRTCAAVLVWICVLCALSPEGLCDGDQYVVIGPPDTASIEKALCDLLPVYASGIWPREEKLSGAVKSSDINKNYISRIEESLGRVLKEDIRPTASLGVGDIYGTDKWVVVPELRWGSDFILGQFVSRNKEIQGNVEFQATDRDVTIAINSAKLFPSAGNDLDDTKVVEAICAILNIPQDKIGDLQIERHSAFLGDRKIPVCYGKIRCNWNERKPDDKTREWWSYMPFWIAKGKVCVSVSTIDWKKPDRPASGRSRMR